MTDHNTASASRRNYRRAGGGVATVSAVGLADCMGEDSPGVTGLLSTAVTDQPGDIADFESCVVTIDGIWVKRDVDESEGREYYAFGEPQEADPVDLQGGERP